MNINMYAMKDKKTGFLQPHLDTNHKAAKRAFQLALATAKGDSIMGFCPEDFELYYIGEFDNESGKISQPTLPDFLIDGTSLEV